MTKKNVFLPSVILTSLILTVVSISHAWAQFDKYKSKTTFNNSKSPSSGSAVPSIEGKPVPGEGPIAPIKDDISIPDTDKSAKMVPSPAPKFSPNANDNDNNDIDIDNDNENENENSDDADNSTINPNKDPSERKIFARSDNQAIKSKKDQKFVNLNPETAFGPEVVTSFDFHNVSILNLTKHMQKLTGLNLILDKDIKGKISISSPTPITIGDAWKAYLQALSINGYSLVKSGAYYTIVNNRDIRYSPTKMYTGTYTPNTDNYVMQIIPLKYVNSREVANSFRPFMSRYGRIIEIKQTNTVIVQETGTHINRLMKLIKFIDIPGHEESLQIIKVKNSSAKEIAGLLDKILKGNANDNKFKTSATTGQTSQVNITRIIAEPRTNSIIAMANSAGARELRELILQLDVKIMAAGSDQIHVYYLNYGDSEALSKTLASLVGNVAKTGGMGGLTRFTDPSGNLATTDSLFNGEVKIIADKDNNALVVSASLTDYDTIRTVIAKLDIPRDQVYVEGLMMETQVSKANSFGITLLGATGSGNLQKFGTGSQSDLVNLLSNNITNLSGLFIGGGIGKQYDVPGANGSTIKVNTVNGLITAIASQSGTNVLATPQILTLDNVEGTFESGEQVPILETINGANGITQTSVKQQKVALTLKITPQINKATRFIKLKIDQKIEDFSSRALPAGVQNNGVGTVIRSLATTVVVRDKDTIAMGGLMRDKETNTVNKIPLLGDIPVLGWLFKNTTKTVEKVNLLFFMTPKILAPYEKGNAENLKDLLNRRQAHLKNTVSDGDSFATTAKGLYEQAKKQQNGPLYDVKDTEKYNDRNQLLENNNNNESAPGETRHEAEPETPDYSKIVEKVKDKDKDKTSPISTEIPTDKSIRR